MQARRVAITGIGLISPWGGDLGDFFERLLAGDQSLRGENLFRAVLSSYDTRRMTTNIRDKLAWIEANLL